MREHPSAVPKYITPVWHRQSDCSRASAATDQGIFVAISVMNCTFASSGRSAMYTMASATCFTFMRGSTIIVPFACITPFVIRCVISVAALPISIWLQAMSYLRPSSEMHLVIPVMACLVAVYGADSAAAREPRSSRC